MKVAPKLNSGDMRLTARNSELTINCAVCGSHCLLLFVCNHQGNTAKVTTASLGKGKHTVHVIDKVLYSGEMVRLVMVLV